ncbi:MAG: NAD-dependent epimerase/dehydratase family protein [Gemmatimonadota bacterium]|nr:MAG: NAD-dependent epimerase/dehydratase family protein [Gemmatimonadota bacterium]
MVADKTVLVTGAAGFVGSHVVDVLLESGYRVRCTVRATSNRRWLEGKPVEPVEADMQGGGLEEAVAGIDAVVHCAGVTRGSRRALYAVNRDGTRALVDACVETGRRIRFVYCSSQAAGGPSSLWRPRVLEEPPQPASDYGRSKLAGEVEVHKRGDRLQVVVLRPAAVYGPRDEDTLPYFRLAARGIVVVPGLFTRLVQLVHARDAARALLLAMERPEAVGRTYFVAHPEVITWRELAATIAAAVGRRALRLYLPAALMQAVGAAAQLVGGGRRAGQLDLRRAWELTRRAWTCRVRETVEELRWMPEYDSERGLRATADWYREEGWL